MKTTNRPFSRGFTLVELLVVIAIIAILAILGTAATGRMRQSAMNVKCISQIKQCGAALMMMINERNGILETSVGGSVVKEFWPNKLAEGSYLGDQTLMKCPVGDAPSPPTGGWMWYTYGVRMRTNAAAFLIDGKYKIHTRMVESPSTYPLLMDSAFGANLQRGQQSFRVEYNGSEGGIAVRHSFRANVFFMDGHVGQLTQNEAKEIYGFTKFYQQ